MERMAPIGPVYQAGTLSGNPLAMTAGIETLKLLQKPGTYETLESLGARLGEGLTKAAGNAGVESSSNRVGSMMTLFFTGNEVSDWTSAATADRDLYASFFRGMLERGVYLAPSQFEATFVSLAHTEADVDFTIRAAESALEAVREQVN
jgi:glutamate-1-semialdehyde 2,1-aminomutase